MRHNPSGMYFYVSLYDRDRFGVATKLIKRFVTRFRFPYFQRNVFIKNMCEMTKQKWKTIIGCTNYAIGSHGQVKRLKHRARGKNHKILSERIMKQFYSMSFKPTVRIIDDDGKQRELSVEKLVVTYFLIPNKTYYKTVSSNRINRVDCYIDSDLYDRMKFKPTIYKTIRL